MTELVYVHPNWLVETHQIGWAESRVIRYWLFVVCKRKGRLGAQKDGGKKTPWLKSSGNGLSAFVF